LQSSEKKAKVLLVRHWMEVHDRGITTIAMRLRDAGFEVIYISYRQPEEVLATAVAEDVDVVGLTFSTGAYEVHVPKVIQGLKDKGMEKVMVFVGGLIPDDDADMLKKQGVKGVFGAGSDIGQFIEMISGESSTAAAR